MIAGSVVTSAFIVRFNMAGAGGVVAGVVVDRMSTSGVDSASNRTSTSIADGEVTSAIVDGVNVATTATFAEIEASLAFITGFDVVADVVAVCVSASGVAPASKSTSAANADGKVTSAFIDIVGVAATATFAGIEVSSAIVDRWHVAGVVEVVVAVP